MSQPKKTKSKPKQKTAAPASVITQPSPTAPTILATATTTASPISSPVNANSKPPGNIRKFVWIVGTVAVIWFCLYVFLVAPRNSLQMQFDESPIKVAVSCQKSVAFGDETEMNLTLANDSEKDFSGTVTVILDGDAATFPPPSETTTIKIESLEPHAKSAHRVKFVLPSESKFFPAGYVRASIQVSIARQTTSTETGIQRHRSTNAAAIKLSPIPYLRTVTSLLSFSTIALAVLALIGTLLGKIFAKYWLRLEEKE